MLSKIYAIFGALVGISMMGLWTILLSTQQVTELVTSPYSIAFHLVAEFATAIILIVGAVMLFRNHLLGEKIYLVSIGMLIYTVINSSGYYAQSGDWGFVAMFFILLILSTICLTGLLIETQKK